MGHLQDPLEYLYEELSAEDMAEAREHLRSCPQCRDAIAAVRDAVKAYRRLPRPAPPAGLADRAAQAALERAGRGRPAPLPAPEPRRSWLFHPAWPVAALVMLCCSLLILVSPRGRRAAGTAVPLPAPRAEAPRRVRPAPAAAPTPLPAARRQPPPPAVPADPPPPVPQLSEAEVWEEALPAAASIRQPETLSGAALATPVAAPLILAAPVPAAAPAAAIPPDGLIPEAAEALPPVALFAEGEPEDIETLRRRFPDLDIRELPDAPEAEAVAAPDALEMDEVVVELAPPGPPPEIIPRPEQFDSVAAARDLSFLIGLQIGAGEYREALEALALLRRHDPEKAAELLAMLDGLMAVEEAAATPGPAPSAAGDAPDKYHTPVPATPAPPAEPGAPAPAEPVRPESEPAEPAMPPEPAEAVIPAEVPEPPEPPVPAEAADPVGEVIPLGPPLYERPGVSAAPAAAPARRPAAHQPPARLPRHTRFSSDPYWRGE